jgi:hypothetical protein
MVRMERVESEMDNHGCGDGAMLCLELDVGKRGQDCYSANGYAAKRLRTEFERGVIYRRYGYTESLRQAVDCRYW